jgi:hypothetical protein
MASDDHGVDADRRARPDADQPMLRPSAGLNDESDNRATSASVGEAELLFSI